MNQHASRSWGYFLTEPFGIAVVYPTENPEIRIAETEKEYANLIAAAPDLLEALEACLPYCTPNPVAVDEPTVIELAEAAIKKARGE